MWLFEGRTSHSSHECSESSIGSALPMPSLVAMQGLPWVALACVERGGEGACARLLCRPHRLQPYMHNPVGHPSAIIAPVAQQTRFFQYSLSSDKEN